MSVLPPSCWNTITITGKAITSSLCPCSTPRRLPPPTLLWKTNPLRPTFYKHNVVILSICNVVDAGRRCCGQPAKQHQNSTKVVPENVALVAAPKETKRVTRMSETPRESCVQCEYRYSTLGRAIRCVGGVESFKTLVSQTNPFVFFNASLTNILS